MGKGWEEKLAGFISTDCEEQEIIQYGLHQGGWTLLYLTFILACAWLWEEWLFSILVFAGVFVLRPYAGGYHADTEIRCFLLSTGIMNAAMATRKFLDVFSLPGMCAYVYFVFLILLFSPLQNPIHPLTEPEQFQYAKRAKGIVIIYNLLLGIGLLMKANIFCDSIIYTVFIVGISVLAGKWKYRVSYIARLRRKL